MTSITNEVAAEETVAAIRGRMVSLTVLEVFGTDLEQLNRHIREKAEKAPEFFRNAPLLLDFTNLDEEVGIDWFDNVYKLLTVNRFIPVGITGGSQSLGFAAKARDIAIWPSAGKAKPVEEVVEQVEHEEHASDKQQVKETQQVQDEVPEAEESQRQQPQAEQEGFTKQPQADLTSAPVHEQTLIIRQPIRSGQKVYAQGGDLIVLAPVSNGAEILADGHIHVYGSLRGRALAGVQGMEDARIFCSDLQADLVAIAGFYLTNEDLPEAQRNNAVQIYLHQEQLRIESL